MAILKGDVEHGVVVGPGAEDKVTFLDIERIVLQVQAAFGLDEVGDLQHHLAIVRNLEIELDLD